tara:strand:+ start:3121 stop:3315 length:195 start_codon:yes stop_codon:yes gene_type:complete
MGGDALKKLQEQSVDELTALALAKLWDTDDLTLPWKKDKQQRREINDEREKESDAVDEASGVNL